MSVVRTIIPDVEPKPGIMPDAMRAAGVTRRELEIFWMVADRLHNKEIADRLHVSARTVESHVSSLLGKLGALDRQTLVETGARLRDRSRDRSSLPRPVSTFIGREREIEELARLVSAHRMVTLTGPAGAGKTRLALQVAAAADSLPPAVFVDLATATSGENVARFHHHREQRTRHRGAVPEARRTAAGHRAGGSPCSCFLSRGAAASPPGPFRVADRRVAGGGRAAPHARRSASVELRAARRR